MTPRSTAMPTHGAQVLGKLRHQLVGERRRHGVNAVEIEHGDAV
jgi:hypothetical protein